VVVVVVVIVALAGHMNVTATVGVIEPATCHTMKRIASATSP
jgi:hypothetical protein